jgi:hypothetical protein
MGLRLKRWRRVLARLAKQPDKAKAIRQWFAAPAETQRKYRRAAVAVKFARRRADKAPQSSKRAKWWRKRAAEWGEVKQRLAKQMEADLGPRRVIPRSVWDANPGDRATARMSNDSEGVFQHHSVAGSPTTELGEIAEMRNLEAIARSRGFADFSYSDAVFPSGRIYEGRGTMIQGAHTIGFNSTAHALCAAGNYEAQIPTEAMIESCRWYVREYRKASKYRPHSGVYGTACPGKNLRAALSL